MRHLLIPFLLIAFTSLASAQDAEQLAAAGKWNDAIEAYGKDLAKLSPQQYRDKKDFGWIFDEYEKQAAGDYEPLKKVVADAAAKYKGHKIFDWRLHRLRADIAAKQGKNDEQQKELDLAIASYPPETGIEPSKHSSLQHLYNQRALLTADKDVAAGEEYILKSFKADPRFVYFYSNAWESMYQQKEQPQRYKQLLERVQKVYGEKAAADAPHRALLQRYGKQLADEIKQQG